MRPAAALVFDEHTHQAELRVKLKKKKLWKGNKERCEGVFLTRFAR